MEGVWNPLFSRQIPDWEVDGVEDLFRRLQSQTIGREIKHKMVLLNAKSGIFLVKPLYYSLSNGSTETFPSCIV